MNEQQPAERPVLTSNPMPAWSPDLALLPNYDLSIEEVYRNFTVQCLVKSKSLDMLSTIDIPLSDGDIRLPSWVPDFRGAPRGNAQPIVYSDQLSQYTTRLDAKQQPDIVWSPTSPEILGLSCRFVDTIKAVSNLRSNSLGLKSPHEEWQAMSGLSCIMPTGSSKESTESVYRDLWKNSMGMPDAVEPGCPSTIRSWSHMIEELIRSFQPNHAQFESLLGKPWECYFTFLCFLLVQQSGVSTEKGIRNKLIECGVNRGTTVMKSEEVLLQTIKTIVVGRKMAYTRLGHVVFISEMADVGDQICIFKGAKVPFLVRRGGGTPGDETHRLLGECFSHAIFREEFGRNSSESWQGIRLV